MSLVHVVNDNKYPFSQVFKGNKIEIPAGKYIEMDDAEAEEFLGLFSPIKKDGNDLPDPRSYKMLRKVVLTNKVKAAEVSELKCHSCGYEAKSKADYTDHVAEMHTEQLADKDFAEEIQKKNVKKGNKKDDN